MMKRGSLQFDEKERGSNIIFGTDKSGHHSLIGTPLLLEDIGAS